MPSLIRTIPLTLLTILAAGALGRSVDPVVRAQAPQDSRAWVAESNKHAQILLDVLARFAPEGAGQFGVSGLDQEITNLSEENFQKQREATQSALTRLQALLKTEQNPMVRQDLEILIKSAQNALRAMQLNRE